METDAPVRTNRPSVWLIGLLAMAIVAFVANWMWPDNSAATQPPSSNSARPVKPGANRGVIDPAELDVKIEALQGKRPDPGEGERNPFRFQPKPVPPSPKPVAPPVQQVLPPPAPPGPPPVPPITLKFMGTVERGPLTLAALTDCKGFTYAAREGDDGIDGRYRLVKIGVESIVMEYNNGTGRTTIRKSGDCPPR